MTQMFSLDICKIPDIHLEKHLVEPSMVQTKIMQPGTLSSTTHPHLVLLFQDESHASQKPRVISSSPSFTMLALTLFHVFFPPF